MINVVKKTFEITNASKQDTNLRGNEYRVYTFLVEKAKNETAECYYLNSTIGGELGLHPDTVRRVINRLVKKGYILKQMVKQKFTNNNSANVYTICEMLDEKSLELKKKMIELFPVMKKGVHTKESMLAKAFETLCELSVDVAEKVEEVVEEVVEKVEEVVEEVVETIKEKTVSSFEQAMSYRDRFIAMLKNNDREITETQLIPYAEELEIIGVTTDNLTPFVTRYGVDAVKNAMEKAYAMEYPHFNVINKLLKDRFEKGWR